ncbi:MAG: non-canonical purine NTP pyrophosphatase [Rhodanobacteraceae bacterium]|nr:non-canonical purine NTP pyrophosphatase [Rhodanobacteraceae bacterium]
MRKVYFVSRNKYKIQEIQPFFEDYDVRLENYELAISELQTLDFRQIVTDKVRKAFAAVRLPVMVDHSGLALDALKGFPGGLTQSFWDAASARFCELVNTLGDDGAAAISALAFTDGKNIATVHKEKRGTISDRPRPGRIFDWDSVFIPEGLDRAYSEMTIEEKNKISQRAVAFHEMLAHIQGRP